MDFLFLISILLISFCLFYFNVMICVFLFLFSVIFLFYFMKTWMALIIFMIYLGGIFVLLVYISSFSSKKFFNKNIFFLFFPFIFFFDENFEWMYSNIGLDLITNFNFFICFLFLLILFFFILFYISIISPMGKSLKSL